VPSNAERDFDLNLFYDILRIRLVEGEIAKRYADQEMRCPVHLSIGQEAAAVGVCAALTRQDRMFSTHRCHAHYLAKGGNLKAMLAEIHGKASGCVGGRGGSMHLQDIPAGLMASVPIVGGSIPMAVGTALADSLDGVDTVSVACFGDAATEEGVFHESMNFAQLRKLPVLFVCENNLYSVYTPLAQRQPARPLTDYAKAHAMTAIAADGNDVFAVHAAAAAAVRRARAGAGPTLLVLDTYRWLEHCGPSFDNHIGYRSEEEYLGWRAQDPLERLRHHLTGQGALDAAAEARMTEAIMAEVDQAFDYARDEPLPAPAQAREHVYAR